VTHAVSVWAKPAHQPGRWELIVGCHDAGTYTETVISGPVTADAALHRLHELKAGRT